MFYSELQQRVQNTQRKLQQIIDTKQYNWNIKSSAIWGRVEFCVGNHTYLYSVILQKDVHHGTSGISNLAQ